MSAWLVALGVMGACTLAGADVSEDQQRMIREAVPSEPRVDVDQPRQVLVWSRAVGFRHSSIPHGAYAMTVMGERTGAWEATVTDDIVDLLPENLHQYDAIILNNTTGDWIRPRDEDLANLPGDNIDEMEQLLRQSLLDFVRNGGGLVGYHSATDSNYHWPEFGRLIGGWFNHHPWHEEVGISLDEHDHTLCQAFDGADYFRITDEIYQFRAPYSRNFLRVLAHLNTETTDMNKGNIERDDGDFGIAWIRTYGEGRVFQSTLGHREEIFWNPQIMEFYRDGIQYALGDLDADATPSNVVDPEGWEILFDGSDLDRWMYNDGGWVINDQGEMELADGGGYIWTEDTYENYILETEFKVAEGTNSGVFFRVSDLSNHVNRGFELQVLDTAHVDEPNYHHSGSLYEAAAPLTNAMLPPGEWNHLILIADGPRIHAILNDRVVIDVDIDDWDTAHRNPDGSENKFDMPLGELDRDGHIGFQDHGDPVWYRNVRIKPLD